MHVHTRLSSAANLELRTTLYGCETIYYWIGNYKDYGFHARFDFRKLFDLQVFLWMSTGIVRSAIASVLEVEGFRLNTLRVKMAKEIARKLLGLRAHQQAGSTIN